MKYLLLLVTTLLLFSGCSPRTDAYQDFLDDKRKEYVKCLSSQDYEYMKHHREMIKTLIMEKKYYRKDSFWVDNQDGGYELVYYNISGYEFLEDGTLLERK